MDILNGIEVRFSNGVEIKNNEEAIDGISYERVSVSAKFLMERTKHRPKIAIICGSGLESDLSPLAGLADLLENCDIFPYNEIPNFPMTTVPGHVSRLLFGTLDGITLMIMQGRFHAYEGHPLGLCAMPVRVMKLCGVETLIVTNAAGGLNSHFQVGDIMVLKDHINLPGFTGLHPLRGPNDNRFGGRFFALNDCYDKKWRNLAKEVGAEMGIESHLHEGVYTMLGGPNFETVAEIRMLKICGVDAVGMSTIPEVLVARHCKMSVFAFSLITNECIFEEDADKEANHEEVIQTANLKQAELRTFVAKMVAGMAKRSALNGNGCIENNGKKAAE